MSNEDQVVEGQTSAGEGQNNVNLEELLSRMQQLESTNNRLLDENKKIKTKYKETSSLFENTERERLEKEGNYQALLEAERKKLDEILNESKEMKQKVLKSNLFLEVSKYASDVYDLEDLLNQPKYASKLKDAFDTENLTVHSEKVKEYVSDVLKDKPWLKKNQEIATVVTNRPSMVKAPEKNIADMGRDELESLIRSLASEGKI